MNTVLVLWTCTVINGALAPFCSPVLMPHESEQSCQEKVAFYSSKEKFPIPRLYLKEAIKTDVALIEAPTCIAPGAKPVLKASKARTI